MFDGYLKYRWIFAVTLPGEKIVRTGEMFDHSITVLETLSVMLRDAANARDPDRFRDAATAVLQWGGVTARNVDWLGSCGEKELLRVIDATEALDPETAHTSRLSSVPRMNAGFTKIYSLLLDGFPIYDSRVAATLGSFIRGFCIEAGLAQVPKPLMLSMPPGRSGGRDQRDTDDIRLPRIEGDTTRRNRLYAEANVRAAWLLGPIAENGRFSELDAHIRLRALEAAFFMIGYRVPDSRAFARSP